MYELREGRKMRPKTFAAMLSNLLYERRFGPFFVEPIVAGIDPATKVPYICNMDLIGNKTDPEDFVVGGTSDDQLYGESPKHALKLTFNGYNKRLDMCHKKFLSKRVHIISTGKNLF